MTAASSSPSASSAPHQRCWACPDAGQEMPFPGSWEVEEDFAVLCWGGGETRAWKPKSELAQKH